MIAPKVAAGSLILAWLAMQEPAAAQSTDLWERLQELHQEATRTFQKTYDDLWGETPDGLLNSSVDLREQPDRYVVRVHLAGRNPDEVEVKVESGQLTIRSPAQPGGTPYEQQISLPDTDASPVVLVERGHHGLVISVAKKGHTIRSGNTTSPDSDRAVLDRMRRLQRQMDRMFTDMFGENSGSDDSWFDRGLFGSSVKLEDKGDHYEVRAFLPDRSVTDVDVTLEGRNLHIKSRKDSGAPVRGIHENAGYEQTIDLPGPVRSEEMNVERKEGVLVITLPKA